MKTHGEYVDHSIWFSFATCDKMLYMNFYLIFGNFGLS
jgi:hypothetical protein